MTAISKKIGFGEVYPSSTKVLLWIGSAIVLIISATWLMIHSFDHDSYVRQREFNRIVEQQKELGQKIDNQTELIIQIYKEKISGINRRNANRFNIPTSPGQ